MELMQTMLYKLHSQEAALHRQMGEVAQGDDVIGSCGKGLSPQYLDYPGSPTKMDITCSIDQGQKTLEFGYLS
ncbi:hypothetical protein GJAV_G00192340 [Gymnothorax javanicus]|nr:hypothetical protein GJAV_G00192340 [Gymnothorax javanicus]